MYECMKSPKLDGRFKAYLLEVWWRAYWDKYKDEWPDSRRVLHAFARGGAHNTERLHVGAVEKALGHIDHVLRYSGAGKALEMEFGIDRER